MYLEDMLSNVVVSTRSRVVLLAVVGLGLTLPALSRLLTGLLSHWQLHEQLLVYELTLAAMGWGSAVIVCRIAPGTTASALTLGRLNVPVTPLPWLGLGTKVGSTWRRELASLTLVITLVTTLFVYLAVSGNFSWPRLLASAPLIVLFAALNAAGEEWLYRVALLRAAEGVVAPHAACVLSAAVFGVAHFTGMPGGLAGVAAAGVLGLVLSRATLDTRGIATAWVVHFVQDIVIFSGWLGSGVLN